VVSADITDILSSKGFARDSVPFQSEQILQQAQWISERFVAVTEAFLKPAAAKMGMSHFSMVIGAQWVCYCF